jgi:hypothetical protein
VFQSERKTKIEGVWEQSVEDSNEENCITSVIKSSRITWDELDMKV